MGLSRFVWCARAMNHGHVLVIATALSPAILVCGPGPAPVKPAAVEARVAPAAPAKPAGPVVPVEISATSSSAFCARMSDGTARCWGRNNELQLGDGTIENSSRPRPVVGVEGAVRLGSGERTSCALGRDSSLRCWGGVSGYEVREDSRGVRNLGNGIADFGF